LYGWICKFTKYLNIPKDEKIKRNEKQNKNQCHKCKWIKLKYIKKNNLIFVFDLGKVEKGSLCAFWLLPKL